MKNYVKYVIVAMLTAIVGYGSYINQDSEPLSNLVLANVEALANGEGGSRGYQYSWTETTGREEDECSITTYYVTYYDCISGGNDPCEKFQISGSETMRKPDCPENN